MHAFPHFFLKKSYLFKKKKGNFLGRRQYSSAAKTLTQPHHRQCLTLPTADHSLLSFSIRIRYPEYKLPKKLGNSSLLCTHFNPALYFIFQFN